MGSNSFHMVIGQVSQGEVRIIGKLAEKVQLAAGLDENQELTEAAQDRALACLSRFSERLEGFRMGSVRVVGTSALRQARNSDVFLSKAGRLLGHPIEIIAGREEARLIYLGASHVLADDMGQRLVLDIGGGSTEFIIGNRFEAIELESLHMGCIGYGRRFFPDGEIKKRNFMKAMMTARREVWAIEAQFRALGWEEAVGASGSIKTIEHVAVQSGYCDEGITSDALKAIKEKIIKAKHYSNLELPGLKEDRISIFAPSVAILCGIFKQLKITEMRYSEGALREGLLYDQLGRIRHEDVRDRTTQAMMSRHHVDERQAERVKETALKLCAMADVKWDLDKSPYRDVLRRAALLHEVGLSISHSQFHKHGAYLVKYSDLAGFSRQEQAAIALLVRGHRRKIPMEELDEMPESWHGVVSRMMVLLRIAVLLHHARTDKPLPHIVLGANDQAIQLVFDKGWLDEHPLTNHDFLQEKEYLRSGGITLSVE
ncbi:MAG: exopolyphosphatase [Pseudomonadales bacterium]|nr:exopolyphosphatase [Pseudomonadales bacterium]